MARNELMVRLKNKRDIYDMGIAIIVMLAVLAIAFTVSGCGTIKHAVKENVEVHDKSTIHEADSLAHEQKSQKDTESNLVITGNLDKHGELDVEILEYDTDKEADEDGNYPVKKKTTIKGKKDEAGSMKGAESNKTSSQEEFNTTVVQDIESETQHDSDVEKQSKSKVDVDNPLMPIMGLVALAVVIFLAVKYRDKR